MQNAENFKRGTVELVILSVLTQKDLYGYELVKTISEKSEKNFDLPLGTLYPVLYRLVENGLISDRDEVVNKRLRKYYHLEEKGKEYYKELLAEYEKISLGVNLILKAVDEK
ncbi:MAG: PadR family transcriptional regulator [Clostridia bacterium]|nr:PadR family transcriptional regulator [Clostridia bacterium]